jgi:hypothetical protein
MRGLFTVAAATMFLFGLGAMYPEAGDSTSTFRICVTGHHNTGMVRGKNVVTCAKCELKVGSDTPEAKCRDFSDPKQAKQYWDKNCCE